MTPTEDSTPPSEMVAEGAPPCTVELGDLPRPFNHAALFGRTAPLALEIGFGSGIFLVTEAARRPDTDFLGIERDRSQVHRTADKIRRRGLTNVRITCCDAPYLLEDYLPAASLAECHIYFSDPWPKKRHHKRRLISERLLPILERILAPGAPLFVKTDVTEYYEVMISLLDVAPFLAKESDRRLDIEPLEGDTITNFQQKAILAGHPIHFMVYRRRAAS